MAHLLIVEDHKELAQLAQAAIVRAGHTAMLAHSATEALAALEVHRFDLVLVDNVMPGDMDGAELVRVIRATPAWAAVPLIAVTARALPDEQQALFEAGVVAVVVKPYRRSELLLAIDAALGKVQS